MIKGSKNKHALLILLMFYLKKNRTKTIENGGKSHNEIKVFFSNTLWTQLLVPLEFLMGKVFSHSYLKIILKKKKTDSVRNLKMAMFGSSNRQ